MSEEAVQAEEQQPVEATQKEAEVNRPEYVPEKFWDTDRNEIKVEELSASYNSLEKKLGMRTDELSNQIRTDIEQERKGSIPEKYEIVMPEIPEDVNIEVNEEQELLKEWSNICKDNNLSQDVFNRGVNAFVNNEIAGLPNIKSEMEILGDNAKARLEAAELWSKKYLSNEAYDTMSRLATTADGVKAIEEIMNITKSKPLPNANTVVDAELEENDLRSMMNDPRYYDPSQRDPAYYAKVTKLYEKKYG
jgi:mRNA deadenylase 3'-5' endonuclease subunit Ccr4